MKKKIMIIDDAPEIVTLLEDLMEAHGYATASAPDAEEGYMKLTREKPDLLLLDLMLPGMDGFEFCKKIRADEAFKNLPVIAVSVLKDEENIKRGQAVGMNDYVVKPFDPSDLMARIKKLLGS
jgi:DNA-binding response OmpR family regulator